MYYFNYVLQFKYKIPLNIQIQFALAYVKYTFRKKTLAILLKLYLTTKSAKNMLYSKRRLYSRQMYLEPHFEYEYSILGSFGQQGLHRKNLQTATFEVSFFMFPCVIHMGPKSLITGIISRIQSTSIHVFQTF